MLMFIYIKINIKSFKINYINFIFIFPNFFIIIILH